MNFPRPDFSQEAIAAMKTHALADFPRESCGVMVSGDYVPCDNLAPDPEKNFIIADEIIIAAGADLQAVIHSHPHGDGAPSAQDMRGQIDTGVIWGIIPCTATEAQNPLFWGDFRLQDPLIGRSFIHGASDCYSLIRAYFYQQRKIILPDQPRDHEWWMHGDNLYLDGFKAAKFVQIHEHEAVEGDCFIGQVNSTVPNHGGVLLDRGLGLHHLDRRLSRREPIGPWLRYITQWLRYTG